MRKREKSAEVRPLMKVFEVAHRLGVSEDAIYKWKDQGILPCIVVGKRTIRFDPDLVEAHARGVDVSKHGNVIPFRGRDG